MADQMTNEVIDQGTAETQMVEVVPVSYTHLTLPTNDSV